MGGLACSVSGALDGSSGGWRGFFPPLTAGEKVTEGHSHLAASRPVPRGQSLVLVANSFAPLTAFSAWAGSQPVKERAGGGNVRAPLHPESWRKETQRENRTIPHSQLLITADCVFLLPDMPTVPCGLQPTGQACRIDGSLLPPLQGRCQQTASPSSTASCWELIAAQVCTFVWFFFLFPRQLLPKTFFISPGDRPHAAVLCYSCC